MSKTTPQKLVIRDVEAAVNSAILFGVSAKDFRGYVRDIWAAQVSEQRRHDAARMAMTQSAKAVSND